MTQGVVSPGNPPAGERATRLPGALCKCTYAKCKCKSAKSKCKLCKCLCSCNLLLNKAALRALELDPSFTRTTEDQVNLIIR